MYEKIDKNLYTPMMRQYLEIKENYPDSIVFFRLGDFYEMFFNDALVASKELEIVLTGKDAGTENERVPMCGVPYHAVDGYIEKLTERGYKVAIVEQLEEPTAGNKKIVRREVTRIVTPGTKMDEKSLDEKASNYIGCLEKTINGYALAYVELSTGDARITTYQNNIELAINEIVKLKIKEIVVDKSFSSAYRNLLSKVYGILISENNNLEVDNYLYHLFENLEKELQKSCLRLISYIINTQKRVLIHLKEFIFYTNKDYLGIDISAAKNLELVESMRGNKNKNNLFSVLDHCSTAMGSRFLKRSILYPLVNLTKINQRLDLIEDFNKNHLLTSDLRKSLGEVYDLERIVGRISYGSVSPRDLIQLRNSLSVLPTIKSILSKMKGKISKSISEKIKDFSDLYQVLAKSINDDAPYLLRDGNIIKPGYNEELDNIRNIGKTNKDFLVNLEKQERERTGIKTLKVGFNKVFGYFIEVTKSYLPQVKDEFGYIRKQTTSNSERYITQELKEREALILRAEDTSYEIEINLFNEIRNICKEYLADLQICANIISEIDMIASLSLVSREQNYVRPEFSLYDEMIIKNGRHPIIEAFNEKEFIPNDLELYNNNKILLITGPNMSGKSTFMRQNAIMAIMAQMGSFVPAEYAKLPIFDQIFTRIGSSDDITSGESTFMTEMLEVNYALQNATERSLIIFDEVGRGTATFDGMALAQAIIEYLHDHIGAKTFFSTHYHELTSLENSLSFLCNVHVEAIANEKTGELVFMHKVMPGSTSKSYGINVANLAHLPLQVTLRATDILNKIKDFGKIDANVLDKKNYVEPIIIDKTPLNIQEIIEELKNVNIDDLKGLDALLLLSKLKEKINE